MLDNFLPLNNIAYLLLKASLDLEYPNIISIKPLRKYDEYKKPTSIIL